MLSIALGICCVLWLAWLYQAVFIEPCLYCGDRVGLRGWGSYGITCHHGAGPWHEQCHEERLAQERATWRVGGWLTEEGRIKTSVDEI